MKEIINIRGAQSEAGFTLIEMMIVVALIAILAAIAVPAYDNYINKAKIRTVQADLVALSLSFENEYQRKLAYPSAKANIAALKAAFDGWAPSSEDFSFASTTTGDYTLTATGTAGGTNSCSVSLTRGGDKAVASCANSELNGGWL